MNDLYFFVSDMHGHVSRYEKLFAQIGNKRPGAVFLGGDLLPASLRYKAGKKAAPVDFVNGFLAPSFQALKQHLGKDYPEVFLILGNDDPRSEEDSLLKHEKDGLWHYMHMRKKTFHGFTVYGYSMVPPTPFLLKDWERYDVSAYVDPGCVHPDQGYRTVPADADISFSTIKKDLELLAGDDDLSNALFLFHAPPYDSYLDRAGLDGVKVDHVPVDVHVGSIAIKEFIIERKPLLTMHGHIHESHQITGNWKQNISGTLACSAAFERPGLALVEFTRKCNMRATRTIL